MVDAERMRDMSGKFFTDVWQLFWPRDWIPVPGLLVAHALGSGIPFFDFFRTRINPVGFIPKQSSQDRNVVDWLTRGGWKVLPLIEIDLRTGHSIPYIEKHLMPRDNSTILILDVGGKFAEGNAETLLALLDKYKVVIVEDTENGHQKYQEFLRLHKDKLKLIQNLSMWSVARSALKEPEDYWTGRGIVEATETIVRIAYGLLYDKQASVFGYGKIGRSIAHSLREKRLQVQVVEIRPDRQVMAQCHGFKLATEDDVLRRGGFVFFATGSRTGSAPLSSDILARFCADAVVAFATSYDDEFSDHADLRWPHSLQPIRGNLLQCPGFQSNETPSEAWWPHLRVKDALRDRIHLLDNVEKENVLVSIINGGSPPNFLFEASCGPYILLVQAAIIASLAKGFTNGFGSGSIMQLTFQDESDIWKAWLNTFGEIGSPGANADLA